MPMLSRIDQSFATMPQMIEAIKAWKTQHTKTTILHSSPDKSVFGLTLYVIDDINRDTYGFPTDRYEDQSIHFEVPEEAFVEWLEGLGGLDDDLNTFDGRARIAAAFSNHEFEL